MPDLSRKRQKRQEYDARQKLRANAFTTAALELGWAVFPLKPESKEPAVQHGFKNARRDPELIRHHWERAPTLNIGVATGAVSGIVVLDVDGDLGRASLKALEKQHGRLPWTYQVETPRGGAHFYFEHPGIEVRNSAGKLGAGLDVRGDGGYVVGAGSSVNGRPYSVVDDDALAPVPGWLLELMLADSTGARTSRSRAVSAPMNTRSSTRPGVQLGEEAQDVITEKIETEHGGARKDRLTDPDAVASVLDLLGRSEAFSGDKPRKISCLLPGHSDSHPSAALYRSKTSGQWRYQCFVCEESLTLVELFASVRSGKRVSFDGHAPSATRWRLRMWHEAGVRAVDVPTIDLPDDLTPADRTVAEGFVLLRALRHHDGDGDDVPFTLDFAVAWCGLSKSSVRRALQKLRDRGLLRVKAAPPAMRCGLLYDLGQALPLTANPFNVIAWVAFDADGLAVDGAATLVVRKGLGDPPVGLIDREQGHSALAEMVLPTNAAGVEVHTRTAAVEEPDELHDEGEMVFTERFAALGELDASRGPAESRLVGHGWNGTRSTIPTGWNRSFAHNLNRRVRVSAHYTYLIPPAI